MERMNKDKFLTNNFQHNQQETFRRQFQHKKVSLDRFLYKIIWKKQFCARSP